MQFRHTLPVSELKTYLRSVIGAIEELPEQSYSFGFVLQQATPDNNISKADAVASLTALLGAVGQFKDDAGMKFDVYLPIYSEAEETALKLVDAKYQAVAALRPRNPQIIKP